MVEQDKYLPLVVALRNYKECIMRVRYHSDKSQADFDFEEERRRYFAPVAYFDQNEQEKLLIYYEDLITDPRYRPR